MQFSELHHPIFLFKILSKQFLSFCLLIPSTISLMFIACTYSFYLSNAFLDFQFNMPSIRLIAAFVWGEKISPLILSWASFITLGGIIWRNTCTLEDQLSSLISWTALVYFLSAFLGSLLSPFIKVWSFSWITHSVPYILCDESLILLLDFLRL